MFKTDLNQQSFFLSSFFTILMKFFLLIVVCCIMQKTYSQSVVSVDYGGSYASNESGQFFSSDIVQTSKITVETNVLFKVGFLNNRLLSLIRNGQNNGTSSIIPIIVFPNPATTTINFFVSNNFKVKQVLIYSTSGSLVKNAGTDNSINIANLSKGFYVLHIQFSDNQITTAKFIKQ